MEKIDQKKIQQRTVKSKGKGAVTPGAARESKRHSERLLRELQVRKVEARLKECELQVAAKAVKDQKEELEEVIRTAMDGFWITDIKGRFLTVNDAFSTLIGFSKKQLLGMSVMDVEAQDDPATVQRRIRRIIRHGWERFETKHRRKDGTIIDLEVNCRFSPAKGGRFFVFIRNITERRLLENQLEELHWTLEERIELRTAQLSEANRRLEREISEHRRLEEALKESEDYNRTLVEANPDPLVTIGRDGKITGVNRATEQATGFSREELIGTDFSEYFTEPEMARKVYRQVFAVGSVQDYQLELRHRSGSNIPVIYNASVYRDHTGEVIGAVAAARDVSLLKQVEAELRAHRGRLEEQVSQRTAQLVHAREQAEAANRAKSTFLANMSHEIRTPINGIVGLAELLRTTELGAEQLEWLDGIVLSTKNLLSIISDVLDLAKVEAGKVEIENIEFSLRDTVEESILSQRLLLEKRGLWIVKEVDPQLPDLVVGDPLRLKQVLMNLLSNAGKFTCEGGITLSVRPVGRLEAREQIRFSVTDTGVGMSRDSMERIFSPFCQADSSTTRKYGGTGLGLAISRSLTELMGGTIACRSVPGKGSTFFFTLPLPAAAEGPRQREAGAVRDPGARSSLSLLLVDDNEMNRLVTSKLLKRIGHRVECAEDGRVALRMWEEKRYDAIIMDVQMPEMDGVQATWAIRKQERSLGIHTPIIALTANAFSEDREALLNSGFDGYACKPVTVEALLCELDATLHALRGGVATRSGVRP